MTDAPPTKYGKIVFGWEGPCLERTYARRWYFIRHAESENNRRDVDEAMRRVGVNSGEVKGLFGKTQGSHQRRERIPDPPLTSTGKQQATRAGSSFQKNVGTDFGCSNWYEHMDDERYPSPQVSHIVCSPMLRAVQTARLLQLQLRVPVVVHPLLFEVGGLFSGPRKPCEGSPGEQEQEELGADSPPKEASQAVPSPPETGGGQQDGQQCVGLTWEEVQKLCPGARVLDPFQWPCIQIVSSPSSLREPEGGESRETGVAIDAWAKGGGWWRGPRETAEEALLRALEIVRWMHSATVHAPIRGSTDTDTEAALIGAPLVVCHGLMTDLILKALMCTPVLGGCSCEYARLDVSATNDPPALPTKGATFMLHNCDVVSFTLTVRQFLKDEDPPQILCCCSHCCCQCSRCRGSVHQREVSLKSFGGVPQPRIL